MPLNIPHPMRILGLLLLVFPSSKGLPPLYGDMYAGDSVVGHMVKDDTVNPSEFFAGALHRPLLQIVKPFNGQVRKPNACCHGS